MLTGSQLRTARQAANHSQATLAKASTLSVKTIQRLEKASDEAIGSPETYACIEAVLGRLQDRISSGGADEPATTAIEPILWWMSGEPGPKPPMALLPFVVQRWIFEPTNQALVCLVVAAWNLGGLLEAVLRSDMGMLQSRMGWFLASVPVMAAFLVVYTQRRPWNLRARFSQTMDAMTDEPLSRGVALSTLAVVTMLNGIGSHPAASAASIRVASVESSSLGSSTGHDVFVACLDGKGLFRDTDMILTERRTDLCGD